MDFRSPLKQKSLTPRGKQDWKVHTCGTPLLYDFRFAGSSIETIEAQIRPFVKHDFPPMEDIISVYAGSPSCAILKRKKEPPP